MKHRFIHTLILVLTLAAPARILGTEAADVSGGDEKWIINSGSARNLPAGSMLSVALALERGGTAVWLDLVASKDDQIVLLGNTRLDQLTDVKDVYPDRARPDGGYFSFDFTLEELRRLSHQNTPLDDAAAFGPAFRPRLPVIALEDVLGYIDLIHHDLGREITLICTLKHGWLHQQENKDLGNTVLQALDDYRRASGSTRFYIASYDPEELQQLAQAKNSRGADDIDFIQLIGSNDGTEVKRLEFGSYQPYNFELLFTRFGLKSVSGYTAIIGLEPDMVVDESGTLLLPQFLEDVRMLGMRIICYRADKALLFSAGENPELESFFEYLLYDVGFDGIVTGSDHLARQWLADRSATRNFEQHKIIDRLIEQGGTGNLETVQPVQ